MHTLTIDIETIPSGELPERAKAPGQIKKAETIEAYETNPENIMKEYRKRSLNGLEGEILSIAYKVNDGETKCVISPDESKVLQAFEDVLVELYQQDRPESVRWIGHNILGFDLPFIYQRAIKHGKDKLRWFTPEKNYIFDTMKNFNPWDYKYMVSLDKCCEFLGIEQIKNGISGKNIYENFVDGKLDEIAVYNIEDVNNCYEIYKRLVRL